MPTTLPIIEVPVTLLLIGDTILFRGRGLTVTDVSTVGNYAYVSAEDDRGSIGFSRGVWASVPTLAIGPDWDGCEW